MSAAKLPRGSLMGRGLPDPLSVPGRSPRVLALHGFTGTPQEVALVVEVAQELGLGAEAPLLPGHGRKVADLAATRFADWLAAAEQHYARLAAEGPVVVAGLSMGSLLAFHLAKNHPTTTVGVIAIANPMWLKQPWPTLALKLVERLSVPDFWVSKAGASLGDPEQRALHLTYNAQPIHSAISLMRAGESLANELHLVKAPTLILHGRHDGVAPASNAFRVAVRLGALEKRTVVFERSHHILTRDVERAAVRREIEAFLRARIAAAAAG